MKMFRALRQRLSRKKQRRTKTGHLELSAASGDDTSLDNSGGTMSPNPSAEDEVFHRHNGKNNSNKNKHIFNDHDDTKKRSILQRLNCFSKKNSQTAKKPLHQMMDSPTDDQILGMATTSIDGGTAESSMAENMQENTYIEQQREIERMRQMKLQQQPRSPLPLNLEAYENSTTSSDNDLDSLALLGTVYHETEYSISYDDEDDSRIDGCGSIETGTMEFNPAFEITMDSRSDLFDDSSCYLDGAPQFSFSIHSTAHSESYAD